MYEEACVRVSLHTYEIIKAPMMIVGPLGGTKWWWIDFHLAPIGIQKHVYDFIAAQNLPYFVSAAWHGNWMKEFNIIRILLD